MNRDHSVAFEVAPNTAFQNLVDYEGYSISSKGFLPTVVDIVVTWVKFTHSSPSSLIPRMSMFTLAVSCLTTSNLPWFMDLTSRFLCNIALYSFVSPVKLTNGYCFSLALSLNSFLFLHWYPISYWAPTNLGSSSFSVLSFCLFIVFMGFSRQECWSGLPFPSPVDHVVSDLSTMTHRLECPTWRGLVSLS